MVLRGKRPVSGASRPRMRKAAEVRFQKQLRGKGIGSELAKIVGPLVINEAIKIGSAFAQKKISQSSKKRKTKKKSKRKRGGALRPAGSRAPARRRVAPMPRPRPKPTIKSGTGKKRRKKYKKRS